jgi:hypothetical protein
MNWLQIFLIFLAAICAVAELSPSIETNRASVKLSLLVLLLVLLFAADKAGTWVKL